MKRRDKEIKDQDEIDYENHIMEFLGIQYESDQLLIDRLYRSYHSF